MISREDEADVWYVEAAELRAFAGLLTGNRHDAEDLIQDAQVKVHLALQSGREIENRRAYFRQVLVRLHLNQARRRSMFLARLPLLYAVDRHDGAFAGSDLQRDLWKRIALLPPKQRSAVVLRYLEDLPFQDIAALLECSDATARSLVARGLRRLRVELEDEGDHS